MNLQNPHFIDDKNKVIPKQQILIELTSSVCRSYQYMYGYSKITALLQKEMKMNHKTVQRIMQTYGLQYRVKVKKRKQTGQSYYIADNQLKQDFSALAFEVILSFELNHKAVPVGSVMRFSLDVFDFVFKNKSSGSEKRFYF
ncbi:IS3 family transposase [Bacillus pumilus]